MMDLASLIMGSFIGVMMRFGPEDVTEYVFHNVEGWLLFFGGVLIANYLAGSYRLQYTYSRQLNRFNSGKPLPALTNRSPGLAPNGCKT